MVHGLEQAALDALASGARVAAFEFENRKFWAKANTGSARNRRYYHNEINCLKAFFQAGINVPELALVTERCFVTIDNGSEFETCIRAENLPVLLVKSAMEAVVGLHRNGLSHGGLHMRNMTLDKSGNIGFLDLEKASGKPATREAQGYDLVVFIWSLLSIDISRTDLSKAAKSVYLQKNGPAWEAAKLWCRQRKWMRIAAKPLAWHERRFKASGKYRRYAAVPAVLDFFEA